MSYEAQASGPYDNVKYPTTANGTQSRNFSVPRGAISCIVFPPSGAGAWKLQAVPPPDDDKTTLTPQDLSFACQPATDGAAVEATNTAYSSGVAMVLDASIFGAGILAFTGATSVATVDSLTFKIAWNVVGGGRP